MSGRFWTYLADLNEQAQNRLDCTIVQMKEAEGITEELKSQDQMEWVRSMNSIRSRAEEIIFRELIYKEDAVTDEQKELFSRYTDAVQEYQIMAECLLFQSSFKLGAR